MSKNKKRAAERKRRRKLAAKTMERWQKIQQGRIRVIEYRLEDGEWVREVIEEDGTGYMEVGLW